MGLTDWFDDIDAKKTKTGMEYTFLTTGIIEVFQSPKERLYGVLSPPCKRLEIKSTEIVERGLLFKRFKVVATGKARGK